jgi:hypothetical protein
MSRFPTAAYLCSWAKLSPGLNSSAGKTKGNGSTGKGNRYLAAILGEAAISAAGTDTFLGARYRRIAKRRGKKRALVAVGRSILVIVWHLLAADDARFTDLGGDHFTKHLNPDTKKRNHIRQLQALGYTVTLRALQVLRQGQHGDDRPPCRSGALLRHEFHRPREIQQRTQVPQLVLIAVLFIDALSRRQARQG